MATKKAPANGVIRNAAGSARHIRAGAVIPAGWSFDGGEKSAYVTGVPIASPIDAQVTQPFTVSGSSEKAATPTKPAENTQASGPTETAAGVPGSGEPPSAEGEPTEENTAPDEPPAAGKKKESKPS